MNNSLEEHYHRLDIDAYYEELYRLHIEHEGRNAWNDNPDGCFFCGGDHHTDCCPNPED